MHKTRPSLFLLLVLVAFGLSLALPAEDLAETAYDESETLPCQSAACITQATLLSVTAKAQPTAFGILPVSSCAALIVSAATLRSSLAKPNQPPVLVRLRSLRC